MLGVHPHDAGIVDHFTQNHNVVRSLHNLMQIVVEIVRQRRGAGGGTKSEQAALTQRSLLRIVEGAGRCGDTIVGGAYGPYGPEPCNTVT
jgi:hypothetical protein